MCDVKTNIIFLFGNHWRHYLNFDLLHLFLTKQIKQSDLCVQIMINISSECTEDVAMANWYVVWGIFTRWLITSCFVYLLEEGKTLQQLYLLSLSVLWYSKEGNKGEMSKWNINYPSAVFISDCALCLCFKVSV